MVEAMPGYISAQLPLEEQESDSELESQGFPNKPGKRPRSEGDHSQGEPAAQSAGVRYQTLYMNMFTSPDQGSCFDPTDWTKFFALTQAEAHFAGDVKPNEQVTVYKDFQLTEREEAIKPKYAPMLRHGCPYAPAPMYNFWAPIGRVASLLSAAKSVPGEVTSPREIIDICQGAWCAQDGDWIFQISVLGEPPNQCVSSEGTPPPISRTPSNRMATRPLATHGSPPGAIRHTPTGTKQNTRRSGAPATPLVAGGGQRLTSRLVAASRARQ